jgi:hypothetical protein
MTLLSGMNVTPTGVVSKGAMLVLMVMMMKILKGVKMVLLVRCCMKIEHLFEKLLEEKLMVMFYFKPYFPSEMRKSGYKRGCASKL